MPQGNLQTGFAAITNLYEVLAQCDDNLFPPAVYNILAQLLKAMCTTSW